MEEKEKPDLKIITYGEKTSPISIRSWNNIESEEYLLEGIGKVSFNILPLGTEDAELKWEKNPEKSRLDIVFAHNEQIKITNTPRFLYKVDINIVYPNPKMKPNNLKCKLTIGEFTFVSKIFKNDPKESWVGFSDWTSENAISDCIFF